MSNPTDTRADSDGRAPAVRASAKALLKLVRSLGHSEAVSNCVHCNAVFLARFDRDDLLAEIASLRQQLTEAQEEITRQRVDGSIPTVTEDELRDEAVQRQVLSDADLGIQTVVVSADGSIRTVVGLNGVRYLPDPYPDPLDEILQHVLDAVKGNSK